MSVIVKDLEYWYDSQRLTTDLQAISLSMEVEGQDDTVLGDDWRSETGGLITVASNIQGLWNPTSEKLIYDNLGTNKPVTIASGSTIGSVAYFYQALKGKVELGGAVGELLKFSSEGVGGGSPAIRGVLMDNETLTTDGGGTARQLGAVTSGKRLYAALHVLSVSAGDELDLTVESDASNSFSGSETTRITFDTMTAAGSQFKSVAGPITDTWWRSFRDVTGADVSIPYVLALGIL